MRKVWKRLKRKVISLVIKFLFSFLNVIPLRVLKYFLKTLSLFFYFSLTRFRVIGGWTLKTAGFKKNVLKKYFKHLSDYSFDLLWIHRNGEKIKDFVEVEGEDIFENKFKEGKGLLVLTLHLGLWELIPVYFRRKGYPVNVVVSRIYTKEIDEIVNSLRKKEDINVIHTKEAIKIIKSLKKGECVGILMDHDFGTKKRVTSIFGRKVMAPEGPLAIAYKVKPEIVLMGIFKKQNRYRIEIKDFKLSGDKDMDMRTIMENFENWITKNPEQWTWIHDRFGYVKRWKRKR